MAKFFPRGIFAVQDNGALDRRLDQSDCNLNRHDVLCERVV